MKLQKYQKKALDDFYKFNYFIIEAPRRSGKTELLLELIRQNKDKEKIAVILPNRSFFDIYKEEGVSYIRNLDDIKKYTLIIGDEILVNPIKNKKTACAFTPKNFIHRWSYEDNKCGASKSEIIKYKKEIPEKIFRNEFF